MKRFLVLLFGVVSYGLFLATFTYAMGFIENFGVPKSIDSGDETSTGWAVLVNLMLLSAFVVQHTIMARPAFKQWWTKIVPKPMERSIFVLFTCLILITLFWQWRPLPTVVWDVDASIAQIALIGLSLMGWGLVLYSSFLIDHFDLFGLRQVWLYWRGVPYTHHPFQERAVYRFVRHPLMLGFLIAFWATPTMTIGHLLFAIGTTGYIVMGTYFEERDLLAMLGRDYAQYRERTPMLIPFLGRRKPAESIRVAQ